MKQESINAVIVEIRGRKAAALTQSGEFIRVNNEGYTIGQQVLLIPQPATAQPVRKRMRVTALAGMAAGFLLLVLGGFKGYTMPVGVVSLDVNPSIEYTINCFDRVLDITAVNDDAGLILAGMDENALRYRPVDEVVDATILALRESGYLTDETGNDVVIAASSYDSHHTERIAERLGIHVGLQDDLTVLSVPVSWGEVQSAHALGTSAGKLHLVEELEDAWISSESFDADEWINRPVREILHETETRREGREHDDEYEDHEDTSHSDERKGQQSEDSEEEVHGDPHERGEESDDPPHQG